MGAAAAGAGRAITTLDELLQTSTCGITAQSLQDEVTCVDAPHQHQHAQEQRLGYFPPALCAWPNLTRINLAGHGITSIPQAISALGSLRQLLLPRNQLTSLPPEVSRLMALTELDVGRNELRRLPDGLCALTGLQVLNAFSNHLTALPEAFGELRGLIRLGLKSNQLAALPGTFTRLTNLVELFLTDNRLTTLPDGFGALASLVKLQASYNCFESLPADMWTAQALPKLELFRLAVGNLQHWPATLMDAGGLPSLAWCSIGSNPAAAPLPPLPAHLPRVTAGQLSCGRKLGQGASGEVLVGEYGGRQVAAKLFLSGASPDGSTAEEVALTTNNSHASLTRVLALVVGDAAPPQPVSTTAEAQQQQQLHEHQGDVEVIGLVMELVKGQPMADRPTSEHLLRCKWPEDASFSSRRVASIAGGLAGALAHLHARLICHGDLYAHNIMLCDSRAVLCDFGAAFAYRHEDGGFWEAMEVRAFGLFLRDLVARIRDDGTDPDGGADAAGSSRQREQLAELVAACTAGRASDRPQFAQLEQDLMALA